MKLKKCLVILPLLALTLSGCEEISSLGSDVSSSEGTTESEESEETGYLSYTLSFSFYYEGNKETLPTDSTIYYAGDTNGWAFTPLIEDNESYYLNLGAIEYGTYEYKLLIEYDDTEVSWDTEKVVWPVQGGSNNASFTVGEPDGGSQEVTCNLSSSLTDILGAKSEQPDTGSDVDDEEIIAAIISSLNKITYLDEYFEASHVTDEDTDYYVTSQEDTYLYGKYESGDDYGYYKDGMLYEYKSGEYSSRSYKNGYDDFLENYSDPLDIADELEDDYSEYALLTKDNEGNYILTYDLTEEDDAIYTYVANSEYEIIELGYVDDDYDYTVAQYSTDQLELKMADFDLTNWEEKTTTLGDTITLYFTFLYDSQVQTLEDYQQIYLHGGWDGGEWDVTTTLSYDEDLEQYYTQITYTEDVSNHWFNFNLILEYSDTSYVWDEDSIVLMGDEGNYWTHESGVATASYTVELDASFSELLIDRGDVAITYVISIYYNNTLFDAAPDGITLYAAGDFNGTWNSGGWYDWGDPVALTNNEDGTYDLVLYELTEANRSFEILVDDTSDPTQDMWGYILGSHTFTSDEAAGTKVDISINTEYTDWDKTDTGVFPPKGTDLEEFYVVLYDNSGSTSWSDSYSITFNAQGSYWNNQTSTSCSGTKSNLASGRIALYSEAAYAVSGTNSWFNVKVDSAYMNIAASTLPSNDQGTPVYVNYGWFSGWAGSSQTWNANDGNAGTWYYLSAGQTIADFVTSLSL